ncbi:hypothetical protein [Methylobacterium platani]|nr:hypothetical protein [Methylobacterium platani]
MIARFGLGGRDVAERREAAVVGPVNPLQGGMQGDSENAIEGVTARGD